MMVMITEKMRPIKVRGVTCSKSGSEATPIAAYGIPKRKETTTAGAKLV